MSVNTGARVNKGSTFGVKITVRDTNSDVVVPSSMSYALIDSLGTVITSGTPSALSSETLISFSNSYSLLSSGETRKEVARVLAVDARYPSGDFGPNTVKEEAFNFTLVNNPVV